jgi:hypothetical protein
MTEIAAALGCYRGIARPKPGATARAVRRDGEAQPPPSILSKQPQQPGEHQPLEAERRHYADVARQPALAGPELWCPGEQHEVPADHPYSRAIRRGGTPAK